MSVGRFIHTPILALMLAGQLLAKGEAGLTALAKFPRYFVGALVATSPRLPWTPRTWLNFALALNAVTTGMMRLANSLGQIYVAALCWRLT
ncbi:YbfB/YjiJ family MFS transporter [Alphaproteobacteria bacterium]|nr:YbfB/YjiJ family MFS transporter [Alphaproteobacteria bacterium]